MKRKLNRVGQNTLTVSLPSEWAKTHNLKPGDDIELMESGNTLTISKSKIPEKREVTIEINESQGLFKRLILIQYLNL